MLSQLKFGNDAIKLDTLEVASARNRFLELYNRSGNKTFKHAFTFETSDVASLTE